MQILEDIFMVTRNIAFEMFNFICRKEKNERLGKFPAGLVELASRADCGTKKTNGFVI